MPLQQIFISSICCDKKKIHVLLLPHGEKKIPIVRQQAHIATRNRNKHIYRFVW
jgi:hypothetical protein